MTQIEQIKAEIEKLKKRAEHYEEISLTDGERSYWSGESGSLELLASFIDSLQQEQPSEDLEKAAYDYTYNPTTKTIGGAWLTRDVRLAFIAGAKWQKEQMMKGAIDADVKGYVGGDGVYISADLPPRIKVDEGDKAKLIIVKKDEK